MPRPARGRCDAKYQKEHRHCASYLVSTAMCVKDTHTHKISSTYQGKRDEYIEEKRGKSVSEDVCRRAMRSRACATRESAGGWQGSKGRHTPPLPPPNLRAPIRVEGSLCNGHAACWGRALVRVRDVLHDPGALEERRSAEGVGGEGEGGLQPRRRARAKTAASESTVATRATAPLDCPPAVKAQMWVGGGRTRISRSCLASRKRVHAGRAAGQRPGTMA